MAVKIRPVTLEDAASYRQCWDTVARERRHIWWYEAPPLPRLRANLRKSLRQKTPFLVAVDGALRIRLKRVDLVNCDAAFGHEDRRLGARVLHQIIGAADRGDRRGVHTRRRL